MRSSQADVLLARGNFGEMRIWSRVKKVQGLENTQTNAIAKKKCPYVWFILENGLPYFS